MRIKPSEGALGLGPSSSHPVMVVPLTHETKLGPSSVSLSSTVRTFASTLMQGLPQSAGLHVHDILTQADREMIAWALELAGAQGLPLEELRKLVLDLGAYRMALAARASTTKQAGMLPPRAQAEPARSLETVTSVQGARPDPARPLALPTLAAADEALARTILSSLALRDTLVDRAFVQAVLDPDRQRERTVDLAFLRRIVVVLSPAQEAGLETDTQFTRRDARAALAQALGSLMLSAAELSAAPEPLAQGAALLRLRLPSLLQRAAAMVATPTPAAAQAALDDRDAHMAAVPAARSAMLDQPALREAASHELAANRASTRGGPERDGPRREAERGTLATSSVHSELAARELAGPDTTPPLRSGGDLWQALVKLSADDRALLSLLYAAAEGRGADLRAVDEVVRALISLRSAERAETSVEPQRASEGSPTPRASVQPQAVVADAEPGQRAQPTPDWLRERAPAHGLEQSATSTRAAQRSVQPERELAAARHSSEQATAPVLRSFESATQLAARCAGTYRSLSAPSTQQTEAFVSAQHALRAELPLGLRDGHAFAYAATAPPLDIVRALGLRQLVEEVHRHARRTRRLTLRKRPRAAVRAITSVRETSDDTQPDARPFDDAAPPRRMFWQLLLQRRMQRRSRSPGS